MSVTMNLGRVKPLWRGEYAASTAYRPLDLLRWQGRVYLCIEPAKGVEPSDTAYFQSLAGDSPVAAWEEMSGPVTPPLIAWHNADYWMLVLPSPEVEANEPGASLIWQRIPDDTTYIERPSIIDPADGTTGFVGTITSSAYRTGQRFTGEHTKSVFQSSTDPDFVSIYAERVIDEAPLTEWSDMPLVDPNTDVWIRVRYESNGFSSAWSPVVQVTLPNYQAGPPVFISPFEGETDWLPGSTLQITDYLPNLDDSHAMTSWQVENAQGQVVWQSLEDASNLTSIETPDTIFSPDATYRARAQFFGNQFVDQEWGEWRTFVTRAHPIAVASFPSDGATGVSPTVTLQVEPFPAGLEHTATEWRLLQESSPGVFDDVVHASGVTTVHMTSYPVPSGVLDADTEYRWQARFQTREYGMAPWSAPSAITTMPKPAAVLSFPLDGESDVSPVAELGVEPLPSGVTHTKTEFRVYDSGNSLVVERDSGSDPEVGALDLYDLDQNTVYEWEARVVTEEYGAGPWSARRAFISRRLFPPRTLLASHTLALGGFRAHGTAVHSNTLYVVAGTTDIGGDSDVRAFNLETGQQLNSLGFSPRRQERAVGADDQYIYFMGRGTTSGGIDFRVIDRSTGSVISTGVNLGPLENGSTQRSARIVSDATHVYVYRGRTVNDGSTFGTHIWRMAKISKSDWSVQESTTIEASSVPPQMFISDSYVFAGSLAFSKQGLSTQAAPGIPYSSSADIMAYRALSSGMSEILALDQETLAVKSAFQFDTPLGSRQNNDDFHTYCTTREDGSTANNTRPLIYSLTDPGDFALLGMRRNVVVRHFEPTESSVSVFYGDMLRIYNR